MGQPPAPPQQAGPPLPAQRWPRAGWTQCGWAAGNSRCRRVCSWDRRVLILATVSTRWLCLHPRERSRQLSWWTCFSDRSAPWGVLAHPQEGLFTRESKGGPPENSGEAESAGGCRGSRLHGRAGKLQAWVESGRLKSENAGCEMEAKGHHWRDRGPHSGAGQSWQLQPLRLASPEPCHSPLCCPWQNCVTSLFLTSVIFKVSGWRKEIVSHDNITLHNVTCYADNVTCCKDNALINGYTII